MTSPLRILFYDIETAPLTVYTFRPLTRYIPMDALITESFMLTWSAKWRGEKKVHSARLTGDEAIDGQDFEIVAELHSLIDEADILVAHYGDKFDWPKVNGRFLAHGLPPVAPPTTIDTKKIAERDFGFAYNKLDHLAQELGVGEKIKTDFDLWRLCMAGDETALKKMERYNRKDVRLLEGVFEAILPYATRLPRLVTGEYQDQFACPYCGSHDLHKRGFRRTAAADYQRWQCNECGRYPKSPTYHRGSRLALRP